MDRKKRIIPCLDVKDGRLVKGVNFKNLKVLGDPVKAAKYYRDAGADEIVFLDITATSSGKGVLLDLVRDTVKVLDIPLTIGGGIRSIDDIRNVLNMGASKVSISSAALENPGFVAEASAKFGREKIVVAIDAKSKVNQYGWYVYAIGGSKNTNIDVLAWAKKIESLGAGEILLTSMDRDGTRDGYDIELTKAVTDVVNIPVIASGGAGNIKDFYDVIVEAGADAVLAASLFHSREIEIRELKDYLRSKNIPVY